MENHNISQLVIFTDSYYISYIDIIVIIFRPKTITHIIFKTVNIFYAFKDIINANK